VLIANVLFLLDNTPRFPIRKPRQFPAGSRKRELDCEDSNIRYERDETTIAACRVTSWNRLVNQTERELVICGRVAGPVPVNPDNLRSPHLVELVRC
jgi:hypothetical protein